MDTKRDILAIDDLSPDELRDIIKWAISAKQDEGLFEEFMPLQGQNMMLPPPRYLDIVLLSQN